MNTFIFLNYPAYCHKLNRKNLGKLFKGEKLSSSKFLSTYICFYLSPARTFSIIQTKLIRNKKLTVTNILYDKYVSKPSESFRGLPATAFKSWPKPHTSSSSV